MDKHQAHHADRLSTAGCTVTRRSVLQGAGALTVAMILKPAPGQAQSANGAGHTPWIRPLSPGQMDTYLAINEEGLVTAFFGKMDMGQAVDISIAQIVAEELDVRIEQVDVVMGDTARTVNQGGASGSTGVERGGRPLRKAAAEARRVLLELAAVRLDRPASQLDTADGAVYDRDAPGIRVTYAELIGGRQFDVSVEWNGVYGNGLDVEVAASPKSAAEYRLIGQSERRRDLPHIILGTHEYIVDVKVPGMWHGRVIRPPTAGSVPVSVDADSIADLGAVQVIHEGDYLAVVAADEWTAVKAAERLAVTWTPATDPFPEFATLYDYIRNAPVTRASAGSGFGPDQPVDTSAASAAIAAAAVEHTAEYEFPFQSHASMAPACAVCDFRGDHATLWTGSQKPHASAEGVARLLGLAPENVRGIWVPGPGSYGRNDAGDAAMDAALLSRATGRPVRVQGMRHEGHAWDPKAPASVHFARAGLDTEGNLVGLELKSKGFSAGDMAPSEANPSDTYVGMLTGWPNATVHRFDIPADRYAIPNKVYHWESIAPFIAKASPLRTAHLRDPLGPQLHFASESFIDELALLAGEDPVAYRLRHLEGRDADVLRAVADAYGWEARLAATAADRIRDGHAHGRGVAYTRRGNSVVAVIADVEVTLATGQIRVRRVTLAADQGIILNPLWLRRTLEGNVIHAMSRTLYEEVRFSRNMVTSNDWLSYPILELADTPDEIDIVLLDRRDLPPYGAGEPSTRTVTPAIANAVFDATGVRLRRAPFTPENVRQALEANT